jgi:hypothetical protein
MNSAGKEKIAKVIGHDITNLLTSQNPPISLKWKEVPSATSTDETKMEFVSGNADDVHKDAARTSCRPKRTLITRNEDFFMGNVHIKNSVVDVGVRSGNCLSVPVNGCKDSSHIPRNKSLKNFHQSNRGLGNKANELYCHLQHDLPHIQCLSEHHPSIHPSTQALQPMQGLG